MADEQKRADLGGSGVLSPVKDVMRAQVRPQHWMIQSRKVHGSGEVSPV